MVSKAAAAAPLASTVALLSGTVKPENTAKPGSTMNPENQATKAAKNIFLFHWDGLGHPFFLIAPEKIRTRGSTEIQERGTGNRLILPAMEGAFNPLYRAGNDTAPHGLVSLSFRRDSIWPDG
ncbi:hypothetical protein [Hyphomicrobium sp. 99]|uniref:hypothetical protein n=1 Tax=Hyphomicrobium sp. 99 TaxID=1163419 RepID=UPI001FD9EC77|nr:hypothetical protein [Hyphomicrobium sp. 99]